MRFVGTVLYVWALMLCTVGAWLWQPYTGKGPPGTFVDPAQIAEQPKDQSRAPSAPLHPVRVATVSYRYDPPVQKAAVHEVHDERTTLPWSCEQIRAATAKLTDKQRERLARIYRLTDAQKADARRCLKGRT